MKKLLLFVSLLGFLVFFACTNAADSEVQKAMKAALTENLAHPEDAKFINVRKVYSNDSLSILHLTRVNKNDQSQKLQLEYMYLKDGGNRYEAFRELGRDSIFLDEMTMNERKKGTIYESLDYENAMLYRSKFLMNLVGRVVGDKNRVRPLNIKLQTGMWTLERVADEFGDHTGEKYLSLRGRGEAYDGASSESEIKSWLIVSNEIIAIQIQRFDSDACVTHEYTTRYEVQIKDAEGNIQGPITFCQNYGSSLIFGPVWDRTQLHDLMSTLNTGGEIAFLLKEDEYKNRYILRFRIDGFAEAMKFLVAK